MDKPPRNHILREIAFTEPIFDDASEAKATSFGEMYLARLTPMEGPPRVDVGLFTDPRDAMHAAREARIYDEDYPHVEALKVHSSIEHFAHS